MLNTNDFQLGKKYTIQGSQRTESWTGICQSICPVGVPWSKRQLDKVLRRSNPEMEGLIVLRGSHDASASNGDKRRATNLCFYPLTEFTLAQ